MYRSFGIHYPNDEYDAKTGLPVCILGVTRATTESNPKRLGEKSNDSIDRIHQYMMMYSALGCTLCWAVLHALRSER